MNKSLLLIFLLGSIGLFGQSEAEIDSVKKLFGAREYTWVQEENNIFKMRKRWTKKWGLFSWNVEGLQLLPMEYDSVSFMSDMEPFSIVKKDGKYGRYLLPFEVIDAHEKVNCVYDKLKLVENENSYSGYHLLARKEGKWALLDWFDEFEITPYEYDKPEDVPLSDMDEWTKGLILEMRDSFDVDIVEMDHNNGDGVLRARNKNTKKWGMYQLSQELIAPVYDSIYFFRWNGVVTPVFQNGKVGFHTSPWSYDDEAKETIPCIYDDYEFVVKQEGGTRYLAVKKDNKWAWIDWLSGELKSEWYEGERSNLPYPYYQQDRW